MGADGEGLAAPGGRGNGWTSKVALVSRHGVEVSIGIFAFSDGAGPVGLLGFRRGLLLCGL